MPDVQRPVALNEPGHRYTPRQVSPRYMEVRTSLRHSSAQPMQNSSPQEQPPVFKQHQDAATKPDVVAPVKPLEPPVTVTKKRGSAKPALPRLNRSTVLRRQIVDRAAHYKKHTQDQRRRTILAFVFGGAVATLLVSGVFVFYSSHQPKKQVLSAKSYGSSSTSTLNSNSATASEAAVSQGQLDDYSVAADNPRMLRVPSLGVQARIFPIKPDINGDPYPTSNIYDAGWLSTGAKPGETGAALLNGYVTGSTKNGIFANVVNMSVGDLIQVELGSGKVLNFKVVKSQQYAANAVNMQVATSSAIAGKPGLNLLTNTGRFDVRNNQFEPRTVVFAVLDK